MLVLKVEAEEDLGILEIEELMKEKGITITGSNLILGIGASEYKIGRDQTEFPRVIDERFVLVGI